MLKFMKKINFKKLDAAILITMTILIGIGLYCTRQAFISDNDLKGILIKQIAGILFGYVLIFIIILIDYHFICSLSFILYFAMLSLLAFTLIFGSNLNNVKRWIMIFGIPFQPSELTKVVIVLFLAFLCNHFKNKLNQFYVLIILAVTAALPMALILKEPHLSSGLSILFIFCIIVYSSGISYKVIGKTLAIILPVVAGIVIAVAIFDVKIPFIHSYQVKRVLSFLSTDESDSITGDFQQIQSIGAIGSGGLQGKLIAADGEESPEKSGGKSREYSSIYAKESDFVFAIVGEEFGFLGSFVIVILYAILIFRCLIISSRVTDYMGKIICIGITAYLMFQIFVNIGVATKLLPNTGLTLPFISYGLTSLISSMIAVGFVLNIGMRQRIKSENLSFSKASA